MRIYLAARFSRRAELVGYRDRLRAVGHWVTSDWLEGYEAAADDGPTPEQARRWARADLEGIRSAEVVIAFTEEPRATDTRGGRHVEWGFARALGKVLMYVGPTENIFYEGEFQYESFDDVLADFAAVESAVDG